MNRHMYNCPLLFAVLLPMRSVTQSQLWSENSKRKIPLSEQLVRFKLQAILSSVMKSRDVLSSG